MKRISKVIAVLTAVLCMSMVFVGCGPKATADETAQIYYDMIVKYDAEGISKLGMTQEEADEVITTYEEQLKTQLKNNFAQGQLVVTEDQITKIVDARKSAQSKITSSTEIVSEEADTAMVKITSTYLDEATLDEKAVQDALDEAQKLDITDQQEMIDKVTEIYINNLIDAYNNIEISEETASVEIKLTLTDNMWMPEDMMQFGQTLGQLYTGQLK